MSQTKKAGALSGAPNSTTVPKGQSPKNDFTITGTVLSYALELAKHGWYVFPCNTDKKPIIATAHPFGDPLHKRCKGECDKDGHGFHDATTDPKKVRAWWQRWPDALVGVYCKKSEIFVIDLDTKNGKDGLKAFTNLIVENGGEIPDTPTQTTPSGGLHYIFKYPAGVEIINKADALAPGIDTRSAGYICTGAGYEWAEGMTLFDMEPPDAPAWLIELACKPKAPKRSGSEPHTHSLADNVIWAAGLLKRLSFDRCENYDTWLGVGMALSELGEPGLSLWEDWSKGSVKFKNGECSKKWKSFKPGHGITLGSLYHWANADDPQGSNGNALAAVSVKTSMSETPPEPEDDMPVSFPIVPYMPELPKVAQLSPAEEEQAAQAGEWLDEYSHFANEASPMTPGLINQSYGLSLLSNAIARRVFIRVSNDVIYPNLYMLQVAQSTLYAKSFGFKVSQDVLKMAGLNHLTLPPGITPQSLMNELSTRTPPTFNDWEQEDKDDWQKERKFAAQRAWLMDEAAGLLNLFKQKNTADLLEIILKLYECPDWMRVSTIGRGRETVRYAYLTVCGPTTPAAMRVHLRNSEFWGNGLFARFLFITPDKRPVRVFYPDSISTPPQLAEKLNHLAYVRLETNESDSGPVKPPPAIEAQIQPKVWRKWENYHAGLWELCNRGNIPEKVFPNYGRLHVSAMKIAMLLAAADWAEMAEGNPLVIRPAHWARAQMITESYRESFHRMLDNASKPVGDDDQELAEKIVTKVKTVIDEKKPTRADLARVLHIPAAGLERERFNRVILQLIQSEILKEVENKPNRGRSRMELHAI